MNPTIAKLYHQHLGALRNHVDSVLDGSGFERVLIASGSARRYFLDDQGPSFVPSPHFLHWLPLTQAPGSWIDYRPGKTPRLIFLQARDYWHMTPQSPQGYWVDAFDIVTVDTTDAVHQALGKVSETTAIIGEPGSTPPLVPNNPEKLLDRLHWNRASKSAYEQLLLRAASRIGVAGHRAAVAAFQAGASEFEIHLAFLAATRLCEAELPYPNIIGLNEHGAVLHYTGLERQAPREPRSFLIDAGGCYAGYASDITRTYASDPHGPFAELITDMEHLQQKLCAAVQKGRLYSDLHTESHRQLGDILAKHQLVNCSGEAACMQGITRSFFPHGLGHLLGLQVHDIGGHQAGPDGGQLDPPEQHPSLRLTRTLESGMVVTIEPGLYFIDQLLEPLAESPAGSEVNWPQVEFFKPFGGIRIEDDVLCTQDAAVNLTREAWDAIATG